MTIVKRKNFRASQIEMLDDGITVRDAIKLIKSSDYYDEIMQTFGMEDIKDDFIEIKGAKNLVFSLIEADEEFEKIDIDSLLSNISLHKYTKDKQIELELRGIEDKSILTKTKSDLIRAVSLYSVRSEYLNMFGIDKYLEFCQSNNYQDIIDINIKLLNEKTTENNQKKKFRLLRDEKNNFYVRAITSVNVYKDYNLRFSLFIALIQLHRLTKHKGYSFYIDRYSLTESDLQVSFKSNLTSNISEETKIGFALELVNDEIKRDAVKFNGVFTVNIGDKNIYIKPDETKSTIISFAHSVGIEKSKREN